MKNSGSWKPGQSGNPTGGLPNHASAVRIRIASREAVAKLYWDCVNRTKEELAERASDPELTVFEACILNAIVKDISNGSTATIDKLMDRVLGKPKEIIQLDANVDVKSSIDASALSTDELQNLLALMKKGAIKDAHGQD